MLWEVRITKDGETIRSEVIETKDDQSPFELFRTNSDENDLIEKFVYELEAKLISS